MTHSQIMEEVIEVIANVLELDHDEIDANSRIVADLGADSLDIVDLSFSLGKQLNIKMPQKTVMMHAEEILGPEYVLVKDDAVTKLGAELLQIGPNKYTNDDVHPGKTLSDIFAETKVIHWANLCQAIKESGLTGDELIQQRVHSYLQSAAA